MVLGYTCKEYLENAESQKGLTQCSLNTVQADLNLFFREHAFRLLSTEKKFDNFSKRRNELPVKSISLH